MPSAQGTHGHCHVTFDEMHTCIVEAYFGCVLTHFTVGHVERVPRVYVPPPVPKKENRKKSKDEPPPPDVGSDTREVAPNEYGTGRAFPHVTFGLRNVQGRHPGDERSAPLTREAASGAASVAAGRPGTAGPSRPGTGVKGRPHSAEPQAAREGDKCPALAEVSRRLALCIYAKSRHLGHLLHFHMHHVCVSYSHGVSQSSKSYMLRTLLRL